MKSRLLTLKITHTLIVAVPLIGLVTIAANLLVNDEAQVSVGRQVSPAAVQAVDSGNSQTSEGDNTRTTNMTGQGNLVKPVASRSEVGESSHQVPADSIEEPREASDLAEVQGARSADVLSPSFLPPNVSFQKVSMVENGSEYELEYYKESEGANLLIMVGGGVAPEGLPVKEGYSEAVTVEGAPSAQIVRGMWVQQTNGGIEWEPDAAVLLMFYRGEQLVMFLGLPAAGWSNDELVAMANSLEVSQQPGAP